ncbi:pilus assembly protein PilZ [Bacillus canaveralius]|uniref:Pilus assembly protein PilZ n=1 Tax=Bacillus canaveralius TaxID=1403243 RepID=A0A2N5GRR1_9BACI|nr:MULTISPECIES: flagellar brake domain-containing protein [Bacillus]PLR83064.1 pilus assembly protein PilZ [Bacillus sp. V33-4]PLR86120.1 pilus assembly protein PilZ [Bacillus canaveralius]PLS00240.1 pilus assembly protein PilZ [Bacillus canaveralius]
MLKIGDVIILEPSYSGDSEKYKCKLVDRSGEDLYIDYPINMNTGKTVFLLDGTQLKASFVAEEGTVYLFDCEVKGRVKQKIPMLKLRYPGKEHLVKIQRRQYVRIETLADVAVHPLNGEFPPFTTISDDISAGGAAILSGTGVSLHEGQHINTWFVLPMQSGEYHYLNLKSKIVRIAATGPNRNRISLQFIDISGQERQMLLRFSFERQLALKKKGLPL